VKSRTALLVDCFVLEWRREEAAVAVGLVGSEDEKTVDECYGGVHLGVGRRFLDLERRRTR